MSRLVDDNVALVQALGADHAAIIGHDWGSPIAANSALLAPTVFTSVAMLSVPYAPRDGPRPTELFAGIGGDVEFYVSYFQEPGRAEAEIEPDVGGWLRGFYTSLSGDTMPDRGSEGAFFVAPGARMSQSFASGPLPAWLSDTDLDIYTSEFEASGVAGALNRYRNVDRDWEDLVGYDGAAISQPSLFIGGSRDASIAWNQQAIDNFPTTLPALRGVHLLDGAGHWIQQERADEVNELLVAWLADVHSRPS
jgi:pimeloyl-ACP methyl ester carboxylesterase